MASNFHKIMRRALSIFFHRITIKLEYLNKILRKVDFTEPDRIDSLYLLLPNHNGSVFFPQLRVNNLNVFTSMNLFSFLSSTSDTSLKISLWVLITISLRLLQVGHDLAIPKHHSSPTTNPLENSSPLAFIGLLFCYTPSITRTRMKSSGSTGLLFTQSRKTRPPPSIG